jgi:glycosyltransferase involved in cell wall biosynthesis
MIGTKVPQISIVMSTYNRADVLPQALASALGQQDVDFELIVVNNGSPDDTAAALAGMSDRRLRVVTNPTSLGPTGGRNSGLDRARGRWVTIHDDDDLWAPGKLRAQLDACERTGAVWAYTGCVFIDANDRILGGAPCLPPQEVVRQLPVRYVVPGGISNVVWRRDAIADRPVLDGRLTLTTDWDLTLRLLAVGPPAYVAEPMVAYRQHGKNLSSAAAQMHAELDIIRDKHRSLRREPDIDRGAQHRFAAAESMRAGHRGPALRSYLRAIREGDHGSIPRAAGALLPSTWHPALRRRFLSDAGWLDKAHPWIAEQRTT